jgi:hypothetical protein
MKLYQLAILASAISISIVVTPQAHATTAGFKADEIMSDAIMTSKNTMSSSQIQSFLSSKVKTCDTNGQQLSEYGGPDLNKDGKVQRWEWGKANYNQTTFPCLKDYVQNNKKASQIIYEVAQKYAINPQVLITLLQKEQGLITDTWPLNIQYRSATGYGCPDTAPCDSEYYGLTNQLDWAARMFRSIINQDPNWYSPYIKGSNPRIYWHPSAGNYVNSNGVDDSRAGCGYSSLAIKNWTTASFYSYTPYRPNQAALNAGYGSGDSCSAYGNRNFYSYFTDWFGSATLPPVIKSSSSNTVYLQAGGFKFSIPSMAELQDYGLNPGSIHTVSDSTLHAIPNPPSAEGYTPSIGHLVKSNSDSDSDGGSVYIVSLGQRSKIQSMQQISDFGFDTSSIKRLPLDYIMSLTNGGNLSYFLGSPSSNVFQVESGKKRIIFSGTTYSTLNPSGNITRMSHAAVSITPSGMPVTSSPILIRFSNGSINLYQNNVYYVLPNMQAYGCWGFTSAHKIPLYQLASDSYAERAAGNATSLSCTVTDTAGDTYILNGKNKILVPPDVPLQAQSMTQDLSNIAAEQPNRSSPLSSLVKYDSSNTVWYLESGKRRPIASYENLLLLGYPKKQIDTVEKDAISPIPTGPMKLGTGLTVKTSSSSVVYVIHNNSRLAYDSAELFVAYGNQWSKIESHSSTALDASYPYQGEVVDRFLTTSNSEVNYLVDGSGCKLLSSADITAYGEDRLNIARYTLDTFPKLNTSSCIKIQPYVKDQSNATIYYVSGGEKRPFSSWSSLQRHSKKSSPEISTISTSTLSPLPVGASIK